MNEEAHRLLRELRRRGLWIDTDEHDRLVVGPRDRLNNTLRAGIRRHHGELLAEARDPDAPIRRSVLNAAEGLGWPKVPLRPATYVGGSPRMWQAFVKGASATDLEAVFRALGAFETEAEMEGAEA